MPRTAADEKLRILKAEEVSTMRTILSILNRPLPVVAKLFRDRRGAAAVLLAVALSGIVGFAGLGSEVASWYYTTRSMQGAVDSAASTAAAALASATSSGSTITGDQLRNAARSVASTFNFTNGTGSTTVTVSNPPASTTNLDSSRCAAPFTGFNCYVEVVVSQPQTALLTAVFMSTGPTISARAVALANTTVTDKGCVVALNKTASQAISVTGSSSLTFSGCALYDNSSASDALYQSGTGSVTAAAAYVVGGSQGSVTTTDGTHTGVNPTADPYGNVAVPSSSTTCNGWGGNGNSDWHLTNTQVGTMYPSTAGGTCGVPQNIKMDSSSTLNLCPGVYVFNNGASLTSNGNAGATINAPPVAAPIPPATTPLATTPPMSSTLCPNDTTGGVTIVLANGSSGPGVINFNGQATINLTAPTTGATAGIAVFQARTACTGNGNNGCSSALQGGASQNITGAIYLPKNTINYSGGSSTGGAQCTQLIADKISFTGGAQFNSNCTSAGTKTISYTNGTLVM
jgi:Flp pilus assembly protein TadG